jgi:hypothetical protein
VYQGGQRKTFAAPPLPLTKDVVKILHTRNSFSSFIGLRN